MPKKPGNLLDQILGRDRGQSADNPSQTTSFEGKSKRNSPQPKALAVNRSLLDAETDPHWICCIDFGTAYSKAVVIKNTGMNTIGVGDVFPVELNPVRFQSTDLERISPLLCPSAIFIGPDRRLYFGARAKQRHGTLNDPGRDLFASPKEWLRQFAIAMLESPAQVSIDPAQSFTQRQLLALLLGYIVHHLDQGLQQIRPLRGRFPRLRLSRPGWSGDHELLGETLLLELMAQAFILARTIGEEFDKPEGLDVGQALSALLAAAADEEASEDFKAKLERSEVSDSPIDRGFVPEGTAAAAAIMPTANQRFIFVVADIGAGTSDFGAFLWNPNAGGHGRIWEYTRARSIYEAAGNRIDSLVVQYLMTKNSLQDGMPADLPRIARLRANAAALKERLFRDGELFGEFSGDLGEFLALESVKRFKQDLTERFKIPFETACNEWGTLAHPKPPIRIFLTGGGSGLPFIKSLPQTPTPHGEHAVPGAGLPEWVVDANWAETFRQLAVAIGGAMPLLPKQCN